MVRNVRTESQITKINTNIKIDTSIPKEAHLLIIYITHPANAAVKEVVHPGRRRSISRSFKAFLSLKNKHREHPLSLRRSELVSRREREE